MKIEIDQSGKVEQTANKTVIADSLKNSIVISSRNKKLLLELYRKAERPRMFVYELFSLLTALLIHSSFSKENIYIIDIEYFSQDNLLRQLIIQFLLKMKIICSKEQIIFRRIGKLSEAHTNAYRIHTGKKKVKAVNISVILKYILQQKWIELW